MSEPIDRSGARQVLRGTSLMGGGDSGGPAVVDVVDGAIVRIRPLHYDTCYDPAEFNAWKLEVKGKTLQPPLHPPLGPISLAYKKRVYSKNRVRYPLKRVDWDPAGAPGSIGPGGRNTQTRGESKYERISWDEAADLVASELKRVGVTYGPEAVLSQADMHGETKHLSPSHACANRLLSMLGGYTVQMRNLDKNQFLRFADGSFIDRREVILVCGPSGVGKSHLISALGHQGCLKGYKVLYFNCQKLFASLKIAKADGSYPREITRIEKTDLLILDDFGLQSLDGQTRMILLEIIEDRYDKKSTMIGSQLPVDNWHQYIGENTIADAIMDRLSGNAHRFDLKGESLRKKRKEKND